MKFIRAGLLLLFAFSVLAFGSVEVWSASFLEIGASILFIGWALVVFLDPGVKIEWSHLNWPLAGFLAIGLVQLGLRITPYAYLDSRGTTETRRVLANLFHLYPSVSSTA